MQSWLGATVVALSALLISSCGMEGEVNSDGVWAEPSFEEIYIDAEDPAAAARELARLLNEEAKVI